MCPQKTGRQIRHLKKKAYPGLRIQQPPEMKTTLLSVAVALAALASSSAYVTSPVMPMAGSRHVSIMFLMFPELLVFLCHGHLTTSAHQCPGAPRILTAHDICVMNFCCLGPHASAWVHFPSFSTCVGLHSIFPRPEFQCQDPSVLRSSMISSDETSTCLSICHTFCSRYYPIKTSTTLASCRND